MARKHAKKSTQKQPVASVVVRAESTARVAKEVPEGTDGAIPIVQGDGSTRFFVVGFKVAPEIVRQGPATGPTTTRGQKNDPKNNAPRGKGGAKPGPGGK